MSVPQIVVREERTGDIAAVRAVHEAAFGREGEGQLVDALRRDGLIVISAVALVNDDVVANAVFSELTMHASSVRVRAVALAPVAVRPARQRHGLGARVVQYGLERCRERMYDAVFVLGDPAYYTRFGFSSELAAGVASPYATAGEAWMALMLQPSSTPWREAQVQYPLAFRELDGESS